MKIFAKLYNTTSWIQIISGAKISLDAESSGDFSELRRVLHLLFPIII